MAINPMSMLVFRVSEIKGSSIPVLAGFWVVPGEHIPGALIWSADRNSYPGPGYILGVSKTCEVAMDRKTGVPEPTRRVVADVRSVIVICEPLAGRSIAGRPVNEDPNEF